MGVTEMGVAEMGITETSIAETRIEERYELAPETVEHSPTLQRWSEGTPDVLHDIRHDPSFRTRIQAGYAVFPSNDNTRGLRVGIEDWFIGSTGLTIGGDYQQNFRGDRESYGVDLHYYLLPLGSYVNVAPVVGYRSITTGRSNGNASAGLSVDGLNLGFQLKVIPSRGGGADFAYTQTWTAPNRDNTARTTELEFGYALTRHLRLSSEIEWQFTPGRTDSQLGVGLEWML
ncbi:MAG: hypothetical protein AAFZ80_00600 [Cyanobacteria bacterium P01_A01_bin.105]